jgi:hypothetical protein
MIAFAIPPPPAPMPRVEPTGWLGTPHFEPAAHLPLPSQEALSRQNSAAQPWLKDKICMIWECVQAAALQRFAEPGTTVGHRRNLDRIGDIAGRSSIVRRGSDVQRELPVTKPPI